VNSIGQPCMNTQKISSGDVEHVRSTKYKFTRCHVTH
jgi:hypothetical protein